MVYNEKQIKQNIQKNIKKYRTKNNLTQKELANRVGSGSTSVSHWELGFCEPDIDTLLKICKVLEIDINEMCGIEAIDPSLNLTQIEKEIIVGYRKADDVDKRIIERACGVIKKEEKENIV